MAKHYVGEKGTSIEIDTGQDIQSATTYEIVVQKPDGSSETWAGEISGTSKIAHTVEDGDFDQAGIYQMQSHVVVGTSEWYGETIEIVIYALGD